MRRKLTSKQSLTFRITYSCKEHGTLFFLKQCTSGGRYIEVNSCNYLIDHNSNTTVNVEVKNVYSLIYSRTLIY